MSIQAADLRKLVKIVRQYEVIYGGGISSSDASMREECEGLVGVLESELGGGRSRGAGGTSRKDKLPSLVDAKKKPRGESLSKPSTARTSELVRLSSPRKDDAVKVEKKGAKDQKKKAAPQSKASAKKAAPGKPGKEATPPAKAAPIKAAPDKAASVKAGPANMANSTTATAIKEKARIANIAIDDDVTQDIRSRHVSAARAAIERDAKITTKAEVSDEAATKRRFAALHLFDAFQQNKLPKYGGFIVCVRFVEETGYTVFEIIGYENLQDIYPDGETLVFKSVGCKLFAISEPARYLLKSVEPPNRPADQMIPYRFSELARITTKRFQNVLIGRKPVFMPTSFSVFKPAGDDLAILFYDQADVYANIQDFLIMILRDRLALPVSDSRKSAEIIARGIRDFRLWMDEA